MNKLQDVLAYPPRGMNADRAAAYCGLSRSKFLEFVDLGILPQPKIMGGIPRWDRVDLDAAWDALDERHKRLSSRRPSFDDLQEVADGKRKFFDDLEEAKGNGDH
jgi:hypothetical protein